MPVLDAIGFVVDDLDATLRFYRALGLTIPERRGGHVEATLPSGMRIMWDTRDVVTSFDAAWTPPSGGHRAALAFRCTDPNEVDAVYAAMTAEGFIGHLAPWDAEWGQRYATLHDPDGNPVDLYAALPA
jgi:catechol 2,3-dioxygenase-like lactoylglutathione lyase family enzyme